MTASATWLLEQQAAEAQADPSALTNNDPIDLLLDDDGDLVVDSDIHFSSGLNAVRQGLELRLATAAGEWFLDRDIGIPYWDNAEFGIVGIIGGKFDEPLIRAEFRSEIAAAPGVTEILSLNVEFDRPTRELKIAYRVRSEFGVITSELELDV